MSAKFALFSGPIAHLGETICTFCCDIHAFCVDTNSVTNLAQRGKLTNMT